MDPAVVAKLAEAGIDRSFDELIPELEVVVDDAGRVRPIGDEVTVVVGEKRATVTLKKISSLLEGTKAPPSFKGGPPDAYMPFFVFLESTVIDVCKAVGRPAYDAEMERLYTHLRRRPDGSDGNPLFSYLQAAVRLHASVFAVSKAELEAVCRRLAQSAGHFGMGPTSTNYCRTVAESLAGEG